MSYNFGRSTNNVNDKFTLRGDDTTLYQHEGTETASFAVLTYKVAVSESGNALTILSTYPFQRMGMQMTLTDESTGDIV